VRPSSSGGDFFRGETSYEIQISIKRKREKKNPLQRKNRSFLSKRKHRKGGRGF